MWGDDQRVGCLNPDFGSDVVLGDDRSRGDHLSGAEGLEEKAFGVKRTRTDDLRQSSSVLSDQIRPFYNKHVLISPFLS